MNQGGCKKSNVQCEEAVVGTMMDGGTRSHTTDAKEQKMKAAAIGPSKADSCPAL